MHRHFKHDQLLVDILLALRTANIVHCSHIFTVVRVHEPPIVLVHGRVIEQIGVGTRSASRHKDGASRVVKGLGAGTRLLEHTPHSCLGAGRLQSSNMWSNFRDAEKAGSYATPDCQF